MSDWQTCTSKASQPNLYGASSSTLYVVFIFSVASTTGKKRNMIARLMGVVEELNKGEYQGSSQYNRRLTTLNQRWHFAWQKHLLIVRMQAWKWHGSTLAYPIPSFYIFLSLSSCGLDSLLLSNVVYTCIYCSSDCA